MIATEYKALSLSIILETSAISALFYEKAIEQMIFFLSFHLLSSLLISYAVWIILPKKYKDSKIASYLLIFFISFIIPVLSFVGFLIYIILFKKRKEIVKIPIQKADINEILNEKIVINKRNYGESSLKIFATQTDLPNNLRLKAFLYLTQLNLPKSFELIKHGLKDPDDEIRLLSFSVINKMEKNINKKIHDQLTLLQKSKSLHKIANIHKELSKLYWEYVYIGLADYEYQKYIFSQIEYHAKEALEFIDDDPYLYITLGKLYLRKKDFDKAYKFFIKAKKLNTQEYKTLPYIAEIYFYKKEFKKVKDIFNKNPYLKLDPYLFPIVSLWRENL